MTMTSAPASLKTCGRAAAGGTVGAVQHHLETVQAVRKGAEQVHDVAVLGVREALDPADVDAHRTEGLPLPSWASMASSTSSGKLLAAAGKELDAVVRGRVVGGGDHDAEVGAEVRDQEGRGRGGQDAGVVDVDARAGQARLHGGGDEFAAGPRVAGQHGPRPLALAPSGRGQAPRRRPGPAITQVLPSAGRWPIRGHRLFQII